MDIHNIIGRLALAKESLIQGQKRVSSAMQWFFDRKTESFGFAPDYLEEAISKLEVALHELKTVKENFNELK